MDPRLETFLDHLYVQSNLAGKLELVNAARADTPGAREPLEQALLQQPRVMAWLGLLTEQSLQGPGQETHGVLAQVPQSLLTGLLIAACTLSEFEARPNAIISRRAFWNHSIYTAIAARLLGQRIGSDHLGEMFVAGLLHDLGMYVIAVALPEEMAANLDRVREADTSLGMEQVERERLGYDHADVGAALAERWGFPAVLKACIAHHHCPQQESDYPREVAAVHLANVIAILAELDSVDLSDSDWLWPEAWSALGLDEAQLGALVAETQTRFARNPLSSFTDAISPEPQL